MGRAGKLNKIKYKWSLLFVPKISLDLPFIDFWGSVLMIESLIVLLPWFLGILLVDCWLDLTEILFVVLAKNWNSVILWVYHRLMQTVNECFFLEEGVWLLLFAYWLDFGVYRVVRSVYSGHRSGFVEGGIPSFYVAIDESSVLFQSEPAVVIQFCENELFADGFWTFASELLKALKLKRFLCWNSFGRVKFQHSYNHIFDLSITITKYHLHGFPLDPYFLYQHLGLLYVQAS